MDNITKIAETFRTGIPVIDNALPNVVAKRREWNDGEWAAFEPRTVEGTTLIDLAADGGMWRWVREEYGFSRIFTGRYGVRGRTSDVSIELHRKKKGFEIRMEIHSEVGE